MSATDFPSRCKDKNNLAKNVQCELYFFCKYTYFFIFQVQKYGKNIKKRRNGVTISSILLFFAITAHLSENITNKGLVTGLTMLHNDFFWYIGISSCHFSCYIKSHDLKL